MSDKPVILIVDDAPVNLQILANCLKHNYSLKVAINGTKAIELARKAPLPDLILLDIGLPDMDGYQVFEQLKTDQLTSGIPIIFVTARDDEKDEEKGLKLGAADYIVKPIHPLIVAARVKTQITLKQQQDKLLSLAIHDQLTGVYNRHYLIDYAQKKFSHALRHHSAISLIMMDIDYFKQVNDNYGHPVGDAVLKLIAQLLMTSFREEDIITRFGGEEFLILLDNTDCQSAYEKAELLRQSIEQLEPHNIHISCSFGITQLIHNHPDNETIETLIKRADIALYQAKKSGRNRVEIKK